MSATNHLTEITLAWLGILAGQIESMKFGVVQITVHESHVVQIEKTEKVRSDKRREEGRALNYINTDFKGGSKTKGEVTAQQDEDVILARLRLSF